MSAKMYALFAWEERGCERVLVAISDDPKKLEQKYEDELNARFKEAEEEYGYDDINEFAEHCFSWNGPDYDIKEVEVI